MTFNEKSDISGGRVSKRGRNVGIAAGGGGLAVIVLFIISQFVGVDLTGLAGPAQPQQVEPGQALEQCQTGADANANVECRVVGAAASLDAFWAEELPAMGGEYTPTSVQLFDGSTNTACGAATSATGPFYCPGDQLIYLDTSFYAELRDRYGSSGGPLAEMYVLAHEWGHHIQDIAGILSQAQDGQTGEGSNAVRVELQADCFAGAWVGAASSTTDNAGEPFLNPVTKEQINDALSAAAAVGDDRIQEATQGQVQPHTFTHGTSEQRQRWFTTGYSDGAGSCNTFAPSDGEL